MAIRAPDGANKSNIGLHILNRKYNSETFIPANLAIPTAFLGPPDKWAVTRQANAFSSKPSALVLVLSFAFMPLLELVFCAHLLVLCFLFVGACYCAK